MAAGTRLASVPLGGPGALRPAGPLRPRGGSGAALSERRGGGCLAPEGLPRGSPVPRGCSGAAEGALLAAGAPCVRDGPGCTLGRRAVTPVPGGRCGDPAGEGGQARVPPLQRVPSEGGSGQGRARVRRARRGRTGSGSAGVPAGSGCGHSGAVPAGVAAGGVCGPGCGACAVRKKKYL